MRSIDIIYKLQNLGKTISKKDCANKVLICMTREWKPKVSAIKEYQNLNTLGITTLFGMLEEHEHEITRLKASEESFKKKEKKSIALKSSSSKATS